MTKEIRICIVSGKPRKVITEYGEIINRNPTKEELIGLKHETYLVKYHQPRNLYTDEELLEYLRQFYRENGRPPTMKDFDCNPRYPKSRTYQMYFGGWSNALKLVGLDVESMVKKGVVETEDQKTRLAEMIIRDHFKKNLQDLAGENKNSPCDGICPNGMTYDVKGAKLRDDRNRKYWYWKTNNKHKDEIQIYYLLAFNEDWTVLEHAWRLPGDTVDSNAIRIYEYRGQRGNRDIKSMKEYEITDKIREILNYGY